MWPMPHTSVVSFIFGVLLLLNPFALVYAGGVSGGGGGTVVACVTEDGDFASLDLQDYLRPLPEIARTNVLLRPRLTAQSDYQSVLRIVLNEMYRHDYHMAKVVHRRIRHLESIMQVTSQLNPAFTNDIHAIPTNAFCPKGLRAVAFVAATQRFDIDDFRVDERIWNNPLFGPVQKAALLVHEGFYYYVARPRYTTPNCPGPVVFYQNLAKYFIIPWVPRNR